MLAFTSHDGSNGQIPLPVNIASAHIPFAVPPSFVASMGYTQKNLPGLIPTNIPLIDPSFSNMQFPQGFVSPQFTHYFPGNGLNSPSEDSTDQRNENFGLEMNSGEGDEFWQEQDVDSFGGHDPENGKFILLQSDKPPETLSGLKYVSPSRLHGSARIQLKHFEEISGSMRENSGSYTLPVTINSKVYPEEKAGSSRSFSAVNSNFLRSRTSSESLWVGSSVKMSKSTKEKGGKKTVFTEPTSDQLEGKIMHEHISSLVVDDDQECGSLSNLETEVAERNMVSQAPASFHARRHHMPGFEVAQTSESDSTTDNSGAVAFYPTGPPIPFLTMLPVYNILSQAGGISYASTGHFRGDESLDTSESSQNFSFNRFEESEDLNSSSSLRGTTTVETSDEQKSDILNSD